jgi:hypothetical protein
MLASAWTGGSDAQLVVAFVASFQYRSTENLARPSGRACCLARLVSPPCRSGNWRAWSALSGSVQHWFRSCTLRGRQPHARLVSAPPGAVLHSLVEDDQGRRALFALIPNVRRKLPDVLNLFPDHHIFTADFPGRRPLLLRVKVPISQRRRLPRTSRPEW